MLTSRLAQHLGGTLLLWSDDDIVTLCHDSRACAPGCAYFAFKGIHFDGEDFIGEAIARGASLVVCSTRHPDLESSASFIILADGDVRHAYAVASDALFSHPSGRISLIGVTGTDGKTSTCHYIHQLLRNMGRRCGLLSTTSVDEGDGMMPSPYANTTPEAFDVQRTIAKAADGGAGHFVLECSSHALDRRYDRLAGCIFSSSCFTRITSEHLEFHGTWDDYVDSKLNLARRTRGPVFVYDDNPVLERLKTICPHSLVVLTRPEVVDRDGDGLDFVHEGHRYHLPFFPDFALENAWMAALLVSTLTHTPPALVLCDLANLVNPPGRQEMMSIAGRLVVIDFAHTPDAFDRLMTSLRLVHPSGSFIALFGASGNRDRSKRRLMGDVAARHCSTVILTEDDPRQEDVMDICNDITDGIEPGRCRLRICPQRSKAVEEAVRLSRAGDVILLLGVGPQKALDHYTYHMPWNERQAVLDAFKEVL